MKHRHNHNQRHNSDRMRDHAHRAGRYGFVVAALLLLGLLGACDQFRSGGSSLAYPSLLPPPSAGPAFASPGGRLDSPIRIFETESGRLLVTDSKRKAVFRVDRGTLQPDQALYVDGTPLGVGMQGDEVFVGLAGQEAIEIFTQNGEHKGFLAAPGSIGHPADLAIDRERGLLLALDAAAGEVRVFELAGPSAVGTIAAGQLASASALAVDPSRQEVLVSDYGSPAEPASVKVFSYAPGSFGAFVVTLSGEGDCSSFGGCSGGFSRPRGLAVHDERVFLTDALLGQVLIYDRNTLLRIGELGSSDPAARDLRLPSDIAVNALGDVFVTSTLAKTIIVFRGGAL